MKTFKYNSKELFFTADLHFHHHHIINFCNRPYKNVDEMNESIIENWNNKIPKTGTTFILGDVTWQALQTTEHLLDQLNGKKILITGNHDKQSIVSYFEESYDMLGITITDEKEYKKYYVHLCHFPLAEWDRFFHGSYHLHGHQHKSKDMRIVQKNKLDVGLDSNNMIPYSWEDVKNVINNYNELIK